LKNKLLKKCTALLCIAALNTTVNAGSEDISVRLNNVDVKFNTVPYVVENRLLIPIREIFEIYGYKVTWDDKNRTASCTKKFKSSCFLY